MTYIKIDTIHKNTNKIHTEKTSLKKSRFLIFGVCIWTYLFVFVCIFVLFLYVFYMYCMYFAECVCIDAPNNFCCKKYKQIHSIQTNTYIIHTINLHHTYTKYIQNKSVTMCIYVYLYACICMYISMCIYVYVLLCYYVYL